MYITCRPEEKQELQKLMLTSSSLWKVGLQWTGETGATAFRYKLPQDNFTF